MIAYVLQIDGSICEGIYAIYRCSIYCFVIATFRIVIMVP